MTTLLVGHYERQFLVHQDLLSKHSPYFAVATKGKWKEGQEHRIPLQCDDPLAVGLYVQWIYGEKIFSCASEENTEDESLYSEIDLLVNSCGFGEKIQDESFRDAVIDSIVALINTPGEILVPVRVCSRPGL